MLRFVPQICNPVIFINQKLIDMSDLPGYKTKIKNQMQKTAKDYLEFMDVLRRKRPEPYVELAFVNLVISMVSTSDYLNQLRYCEIEMYQKEAKIPIEACTSGSSKLRITSDAEKALLIQKIY